MLGKYEESIVLLDKGLEMDPLKTEALYFKGILISQFNN